MDIFTRIALVGLLAAPFTVVIAATQPTPMTQGNVTFITGGVGSDEAQTLANMEKDYSLTLQFTVRAKPRDEFTAGVQVKLIDNKGTTVLDVTTDGPFLLAKLAPGRYKMQASKNGEVQTRDLTVSAGKPLHLLVEMAT